METASTTSVYPLQFKPDLEEADRRWQAYLAGEIIDRPIVRVCAPRTPGAGVVSRASYRDAVFGDLEAILDQVLELHAGVFFGGEAVPTFQPSISPDEMAVFCGAELLWNDNSGETNWVKPFVEDWETALPFRLQEDHSLWQRLLAFYRLAAEKFEGKMLLGDANLPNFDLVAAARGPELLCMDLVEQPELIDAAARSVREMFSTAWNALVDAGRMQERGFYRELYSMEGSAVLQCDFSCMISPAMFERWVLPDLEESGAIVKHAYYHWDGPGAVKHIDLLCACHGIHTLGYVPGAGEPYVDQLDLWKQVQSRGKAVDVHASPEACKAFHRELKPEKTMYTTYASTPQEAEDLLKWFTQNT